MRYDDVDLNIALGPLGAMPGMMLDAHMMTIDYRMTIRIEMIMAHHASLHS